MLIWIMAIQQRNNRPIIDSVWRHSTRAIFPDQSLTLKFQVGQDAAVRYGIRGTTENTPDTRGLPMRIARVSAAHCIIPQHPGLGSVLPIGGARRRRINLMNWMQGPCGPINQMYGRQVVSSSGPGKFLSSGNSQVLSSVSSTLLRLLDLRKFLIFKGTAQ